MKRNKRIGDSGDLARLTMRILAKVRAVAFEALLWTIVLLVIAFITWEVLNGINGFSPVR